MVVILLFVLLSILYSLEASTNISRKIGYNIENPSSGLFFQSALSIFSRLVMFVFMPLIGYLSDTKSLKLDYFLFGYIIVPISLFFVITYKKSIERIFGSIILRLDENGSYFIKAKNKYTPTCSTTKKNVFNLKFKITYVIASLPFLLSWPVIIIAIIKFDDYRATIIGLSAFLNGFYTLYLSLFVDPVLSKLGKYKNVIIKAYDEILDLKLVASLISLLIYFSCLLIFFLN